MVGIKVEVHYHPTPNKPLPINMLETLQMNPLQYHMATIFIPHVVNSLA